LLRWELVLHDGRYQTWSWRRIAPDGSIQQSSSPLPDFGKAIADAIEHGFLPREHDWIVNNRGGTTHFPAHKPPMSIARNGDVVYRAEAVEPKVSNAGGAKTSPG